MPSRRLTPRTAPDVRLSAILARNLLVDNPAGVIEELRAVAGADVELLAQVADSFQGRARESASPRTSKIDP
jgi:hypothetical protein